jgi:hypothetical protein
MEDWVLMTSPLARDMQMQWRKQKPRGSTSVLTRLSLIGV